MRRPKPYCFGVYVITDGNTSGLLLKRKKENEAYSKYAYFWLKQPQGLAPTKEIKQSCGANCYGLESYEEYKEQKHKYAKYRDQERIFNELKNYAEAVVTNPDAMNTPRELTQDYSYATKGYSEVLSRFFERENSPLRDFLISSEVFRKYVLKKLYGHDKVVGMAEEFGVREPHNVFPEENFHYLRPIEKVLEIGISQEPEWFRKRGPVAVDFDDERIYRRKKTLKQLNNLIMDNSVSLLEGISGTGKTVLVLNLAYDLSKSGESSVYFFDCAKYRSFDQSQLVHEIESVKSIFIIENIHLEPRKAQLVYSRFKHNPERHILFTSRPSYKEFQDIFSEDLRKIKQIRLEPFDETENITKRFCSHPATPKVVTKKRTQFLEMSKMNYWLLAFALQGCAKSPENSEPKSWIADEVKEYLRNLKTCNDPYCDQYPGILLALSPLYKNEVSTAEHYLIDKLKFTEPALNDLVKRGEITEQNDLNDNTLYGLPHSSLADAYWEHGQQYLRREDLRDYVTFIRDYATSNVTNGLTAIMKSNYSVRSSIISDLWKSGEIASAIKSENSMATIASWHMGHCFVDAPDTAVSEVLARKIAVAGDFYAASYCFMRDLPCDYSRQLWKLLDKNKLAHTLCCSDNLHEVTFFIYSLLRGVGIKAARELCGHLRISRLAETMVTKSNLNNACELIYFLLCIDNDKGRALWNSLNKQQLACIIAMENVDKVCFAFGSLFAGDDDVGWECWDLFGRKILATRLSSIQDVQYLERCTSNFLQYDPGDLWMTFQGDYFSSMWGYPRSLFSYKEKGQALYWERAALEFFQILDWQELLNKSEQFQDEMNILICMATRCGTYPWAGSRLPPIQNP